MSDEEDPQGFPAPIKVYCHVISPNIMKSDGFIMVSHKHRRKRCRNKPAGHPSIRTDVKVDALEKSKIESIQKDLKCSEFFSNFKEILIGALSYPELNATSDQQGENLDNLTDKIGNVLINDSDKIDIVCYGLGNFISCMIARYQLAFLMVLKDVLQPHMISLYDPVFVAEEKSFLEELGLEVLNVNEEAKRTITRRTVFFMPHCDLPLYDNLLCANWKEENLSKLIIIGNSFKSYLLSHPNMKFKKQAKYVYFATEIASEVGICNNFTFRDIFNDLSLHYFQPNSLSKLSMWDDTNEIVTEETTK